MLFGLLCIKSLLEELASQLLYLVDEESGKSQAGQVGRQMLLSVPVVVFKVVALCFQRVKGFVFNFPLCAGSSHDFCHVLLGELYIGYPCITTGSVNGVMNDTLIMMQLSSLNVRNIVLQCLSMVLRRGNRVMHLTSSS